MRKPVFQCTHALVVLSLLGLVGCYAKVEVSDSSAEKAITIHWVDPPCAEPGSAAGYIEGNGFGAKNVTITVGGIEAQVLTATGMDASFVVPEGIPSGPIEVVVENPGGRIAMIQWVSCEIECDPPDCNDDNECTTDTCDTADGTCMHEAVPDGTFCGTDGVCDAGACRERSWTGPVLISDPSIASGGPKVAAGLNGDVVVVWISTSSATAPWSNRYTPTTGWGVPEAIYQDLGVTAMSSVDIAVDAAGRATAVWTHEDATGWQPFANESELATGWGAGHPIGVTTPAFATHASVAVNQPGSSFAVWNHKAAQSLPRDVYSNRSTPSDGWGTAEVIDEAGTGADNPCVGVDSMGNAIAAWTQSDSVGDSLWAGRYTPSGGWDTPQRVDDHLDADRALAALAVNPAGDAVLVWTQREDTRDNIWASHFTPSTGWDVPVLIEDNDAGSARSPAVAMDPSGTAIVVWNQADTSNWHSVWANRYTPVAGWGVAGPIENGSTDNIFASDIAMDAGGNAVVVWTAGGGIRIEANRFAPATGWGTPQSISGTNVENPQVAIDGSGSATAVWHDHSGSHLSVWSNRYE